MLKLQKNKDFFSIPHLLHIEMTYACNANCLPCYNPERGVSLDLSKMDSLVEAVSKWHIPHVYIIGGEPSLIPVKKVNEWIDILSLHSSVTIVTNGIVTMKGVDPRLSCFGVPIHGSNAKTHEIFNQHPGSFSKVLDTVRYYVKEGFDVRCIPVLVGFNYDQMYDIIKIARDLGMESVFVDRYEDGGLGATRSEKYPLKPTAEQFREGVSQILKALKDFPEFKGRIGFGTAIPFCLDERIVEAGITADCGVGTYFCAVNPNGDLRICNQSQRIYGNILQTPIPEIWQSTKMLDFRDLKWVDYPCSCCSLLRHCMCGCKVDANCSKNYCIDYAVRKKEPPSEELISKFKQRAPTLSYPDNYRVFKLSPYSKLTLDYKEKYLVTRYQTVIVDTESIPVLKFLLSHSDNVSIPEYEIISYFSSTYEVSDLRIFLSQLLEVDAISLVCT